MYVQFMSFFQGDNSQCLNTILVATIWQSDVKKLDQIVVVMFGFGMKVFSICLVIVFEVCLKIQRIKGEQKRNNSFKFAEILSKIWRPSVLYPEHLIILVSFQPVFQTDNSAEAAYMHVNLCWYRSRIIIYPPVELFENLFFLKFFILWFFFESIRPISQQLQCCCIYPFDLNISIFYELFRQMLFYVKPGQKELNLVLYSIKLTA